MWVFRWLISKTLRRSVSSYQEAWKLLQWQRDRLADSEVQHIEGALGRLRTAIQTPMNGQTPNGQTHSTPSGRISDGSLGMGNNMSVGSMSGSIERTFGLLGQQRRDLNPFGKPVPTIGVVSKALDFSRSCSVEKIFA